MKDEKIITLKRMFESGDVSFFECVREGYHLFKEAGHTDMDERFDFNKAQQAVSERDTISPRKIKGFKWTGWIKSANQAPDAPHQTYSMDTPKYIPCDHDKEITLMRRAYQDRWPAALKNGGIGFLVGSSLVGNKQGDSARFHELKALCAKQCHG